MSIIQARKDAMLLKITQERGPEMAEAMRGTLDLVAESYVEGIKAGMDAAAAALRRYLKVMPHMTGNEISHFLILETMINRTKKDMTEDAESPESKPL